LQVAWSVECIGLQPSRVAVRLIALSVGNLVERMIFSWYIELSSEGDEESLQCTGV